MTDNTWPAAKTADGVTIVPGLRVWNNDLRAGTVTDRAPHLERNYNPGNGPVFPAEGSETPWFHVEVDGRSGTDDFDGSRLVTVHPFTGKKA